jgi:cytoplasmic tRNA 2-thiolation protein 1
LAKEHAQRYRPRIKDDLKVVHVVTGDDWEGVERLRESVLGIDPSIDFIAVPFRYVLEKEEALFRYLHDRDNSQTDLDAEASGGVGELNDLESLVEGCSSNSGARSDMGSRLVKLLCLRVAKMVGCTKVALGCNGTFFATHIITSILKGSGFALPADVNYIDHRPSASGLPDIIHPLRDCVSKEILLLCYLHNIEFTHDPKDIFGDRTNIRSICKDFVFDQQDRLSSTVNTVVRTATKIDYNGIKEETMKVLDQQGRIKADKMCYLCSAPMCNSSKDFILSQQEQHSPHSGVVGGSSIENICYSCCMVFQNLDSNFKFWSGEDNQKSMKKYFCRELSYAADDIQEVRPLPVASEDSSSSSSAPTPAPTARSTRGMKCAYCKVNRAMLKRPKTKECVCKECFYFAFEEEIHKTIIHEKIFTPGDRVAIGASGGKDSTVLIHTLKTLNERYNYGIELFLLSVDEGIKGYRDDSLETVARNEQQYGIPLEVVSYKDLYGYSMDDIVAQIGLKNNCTFCGVFRRQALDRGAVLLKANKIVTGHNADDIAETVFLNVLRGDFPRLTRCTNSITGEDSALPRCKPFKYTYEKEIVMYAFHKRLDYFATECTYSPQAYRGFTREFIKDVEIVNPVGILNTIVSADEMKLGTDTDKPLQVQGECKRCGYITSQKVCKACVLLEGLRKGNARFGISKASSKISKPLSQSRQ